MPNKTKRGGLRNPPGGRPKINKFSRYTLVLNCTLEEARQIRMAFTTRERAEVLLGLIRPDPGAAQMRAAIEEEAQVIEEFTCDNHSGLCNVLEGVRKRLKEIPKINTQTETIICPNCGSQEEAMASQTGTEWWAYIHWCRNCEYCIMESEWCSVNES